jgi:hypothetical protein
MSPFFDVTTLEMSPNLEASTGGQIGKGSDEREGVAAGILALVESGKLSLSKTSLQTRPDLLVLLQAQYESRVSFISCISHQASAKACFFVLLVFSVF